LPSPKRNAAPDVSFFKRWGGVRKSATGRTLDERTHDEQPAVRDAAMPGRRVRLEMVGVFDAVNV